MDLNKLTKGDKIVGAGALLFLIGYFMKWFSYKGYGNYSGNHFLFTGTIPLLLIVAVVVVIVLQRMTSTDLPKLPLSWNQVTLLVSALATALVVLRLLIGYSEDYLVGSLDLNREVGLLVATVGAVIVTLGTAMAFKEAGGTMDSLKSDIKNAANRPDNPDSTPGHTDGEGPSV